MKNTILKGTGNSRTLKSVADFKQKYPTYDDFAAALIAGTLPIDLGALTAVGVDTVGTSISEGNLLSDKTAAMYGLDGNAVPDSAFQKIAVTKQDKLTGDSGQFVGFDVNGDPIPYRLTVTDSLTAQQTGNTFVISAKDLNYPNAGAHNAIYRGKYLGNSVTTAQYAEISAGTFNDLYIGDYWTIGGINYRIAAFDYYLRSGDKVDLQTHHVTIVPDTGLGTAKMNDANTTDGGYIGSKMRKENILPFRNKIKTAFGENHILTRREYLVNAVTNGRPTTGSWFDVSIELMTEVNVYGCPQLGVMNDGTNIPARYTVDKSQYPLFAFRPDMISNRQWFWLRDVVSATHFASVASNGNCGNSSASGEANVRPAFSIS